ncbi:Uma2 family endonuclease [Streptomyces sp. BK79]|uniref:Uma2 family endonuclease n=1 Tax=Streptomyces sp. BK79 TaxID=3350097 RepID=UPI0037704978
MDYARMRAIAADLGAYAERLDGTWLGEIGDSTQVLACVEIVSPSNPGNDYDEKLSDYPAMGIPLHMIVDPRTGTIQVHSEPCQGRYSRKEPYIFGDTVPFGPWTVETSEFRRYGKEG